MSEPSLGCELSGLIWSALIMSGSIYSIIYERALKRPKFIEN
jgi:hypothetical protein